MHQKLSIVPTQMCSCIYSRYTWKGWLFGCITFPPSSIWYLGYEGGSEVTQRQFCLPRHWAVPIGKISETGKQIVCLVVLFVPLYVYELQTAKPRSLATGFPDDCKTLEDRERQILRSCSEFRMVF